MFGIGFVVAILVTLVAVLIPWLPTSASEEMDRITFTYWFATVICIAIFALVAAVIIYSVVAFRAPPEDDIGRAADPRPHRARDRLDGRPGDSRDRDRRRQRRRARPERRTPGTNPLTVNVFAQQFAWRFEYPDSKLKSDELVLPLGRSVKLDIESADVIHSFWVPQMGQKQDVVPGITTTSRDHADEARDLHASSAPSSAASATRRCARPSGCVTPGRRSRPGSKKQQAGGGGGGDERRRRVVRGGRAAAAATRSSRPAPTRRSGPALDDVAADAQKAGEDPTTSASRSSIPNEVSPPGYQPGVMPKNYGDILSARRSTRSSRI